MNTLRIFVFSACGRPGGPRKLGCLEPALGRFDAEAAAQYDAIFAAAERHGVKVVLTLLRDRVHVRRRVEGLGGEPVLRRSGRAGRRAE